MSAVLTLANTPDEAEFIMCEALKDFTSLEAINRLEEELLPLGSIDVKTDHLIAGGVYARQVTVPAGCLAIGHAHKFDCINIVSSGSVSVVIDGVVTKVSAPGFFVSPALTRKIGYVHEDLIWTTVHRTNKFIVAECEDESILKSDAFRAHEALTGSGVVAVIDSSAVEKAAISSVYSTKEIECPQ